MIALSNRLAFSANKSAIRSLFEYDGPPISLLVSYVYLKCFLKVQGQLKYRDWVLDSGAFSALNKGETIDVVGLAEKAKELLATDKTLTEVFALDVIGNWKESLKNTETMWRLGVPAIPTYHVGEPDHYLIGIAKDYPKIALGGMAMNRGRNLEWLKHCFARVWPKRIHGFACTLKKTLLELPFESADSVAWALGPLAFGGWTRFGKMSVRHCNSPDLRCQVYDARNVEEFVRLRWIETWAAVEKLLEERERECRGPSLGRSGLDDSSVLGVGTA